MFSAKGREELGDGVNESYGAIRFGYIIGGLSDLAQY